MSTPEQSGTAKRRLEELEIGNSRNLLLYLLTRTGESEVLVARLSVAIKD